jgi:hypothetical protein
MKQIDLPVKDRSDLSLVQNYRSGFVIRQYKVVHDVRSSRRDDLRVRSHLFCCFPGVCCPCRVLPVLSVPAGHKRLFRGTNQAGPTVCWRAGHCLAMRISGHHRPGVSLSTLIDRFTDL